MQIESRQPPDYRGLSIPFVSFGRVNSDDLFEEREQALFDFYERNASRYHRALDVGANIGIHSLVMARQGWTVRAFEPDPEHYEHLLRNIGGLSFDSVIPYRVALSDRACDCQFVRVLDNTTASHLEGARSHFGPVERITVHAIEAAPFFAWADLAKIDVEGHEAALVSQWSPSHGCDLLVEVGTADSAAAIYEHVQGKAPIWRQDGRQWRPVTSMGGMPTHYRKGSVFVGKEP